MFRKILLGIFAVAVVLAATAFATAPSELVNEATLPIIDADVDEWLAQKERAVSNRNAIIPNTEKRIRWYQGQNHSKTRYSLVYFPGFSATRQEIAPVGAMIADALEANLFETRLTGHGHLQNPLVDVRAEDWLEDAAEALAVGSAIGESIIVMGTSTGATLALAMTDHPSFLNVSTVVLLSPNIALRDTNSEFMTWPGGPQLTRLIIGEKHRWEPGNELQGQYWSTSYPVDALVEMMRLVKYVRNRLPMQIDQALLTIYSPADQVVDTEWITRAFEEIDSPRKKLITVSSAADPGNHVLAGDIMAPENNHGVADSVIRFVTSGEASH